MLDASLRSKLCWIPWVLTYRFVCEMICEILWNSESVLWDTLNLFKMRTGSVTMDVGRIPICVLVVSLFLSEQQPWIARIRPRSDTVTRVWRIHLEVGAWEEVITSEKCRTTKHNGTVLHKVAYFRVRNASSSCFHFVFIVVFIFVIGSLQDTIIREGVKNVRQFILLERFRKNVRLTCSAKIISKKIIQTICC